MPGGGRLTVETALDDALPGGAVSLRVSDTGTGMDRATVERIWEPFFTTKDAGRGTGLGLATVRGIVERSGGAVRVESEPGRGTVFHVTLPRAVPEAAAPEEPAPAEARPAGGSETVLLVEDDEAVRTLVQLILERQGYTVLPAADGSQALRAVLRSGGPVHLLVTDVVMPGMNGRELAEQLAAHAPGVRVVYMSGYSEREMERYGIRGPNAVRVRKPFSPAQLARAVRDALDREVPSPEPEPTHP
ncbi:MAG TPA: ATP-binding protein, partial [Longimicrobiaceae bacterium]